MNKLPGDWKELRGVSGSGWYVVVAYRGGVLKPEYAIFYKRIDAAEFTLGKFGACGEIEKTFNTIHKAFRTTGFDPKVHFTDTSHPLWGRF